MKNDESPSMPGRRGQSDSENALSHYIDPVTARNGQTEAAFAYFNVFSQAEQITNGLF